MSVAVAMGAATAVGIGGTGVGMGAGATWQETNNRERKAKPNEKTNHFRDLMIILLSTHKSLSLADETFTGVIIRHGSLLSRGFSERSCPRIGA